MPRGYVYILASEKHGVTRLVWYDTCDLVTDAIQRETTMKHWPRQWKINLIEKDNPDWNDLSQQF